MRDNLRAARKAKGLTQQQMADELAITLRHYQKIEYGDTIDFTKKILKATMENP